MAGLREEKEDWLTEEGGNLTLFKKSNPNNGPTVTAVTHQVKLQRMDGSIIFDFTVSRTFFSKFIQHCFICRPIDSTVSVDAGLGFEPRTVAEFACTVKAD
jgi:hypothetical protein